MGYELNLHVVDHMPTFEYPATAIGYFEDLMINVYKPGSYAKLLALSLEYLVDEKPNPYYYRQACGELDSEILESNEDVTVLMKEDPYGKWAIPCPIEEVIKALVADQALEQYRRFEIALAALTVYAKHFPKAIVFFEGH